MDRNYAAAYKELYRHHWWWRAREDFLVRVLTRLQPPGGWERLLDVGCGDALFFDRLQAFGLVEGVEEDSSLVDPSGRWASQIYLQSFTGAFEPDHRYGLILMLDVLEHLPAPLDALRKAGRLLMANGQVVITVPAFQALWTAHDEANHHFARYTRRGVSRLVERAGLRVESASYFFHWMVPVKLAVRLKETLLGSRSGHERLPPAVVNRLLHGVSRVEQRVLGRAPLPFGTSLLIVATAAAVAGGRS
jgi:SAM-dependent methyltransferase